MMDVAKNNVNTLGLGLDLESRYQEAERVPFKTCCLLILLVSYDILHINKIVSMQEMLFRRTCKIVEVEGARRNAERAKPVKKTAVSVCAIFALTSRCQYDAAHTMLTSQSLRRQLKPMLFDLYVYSGSDSVGSDNETLPVFIRWRQ